MTLVKTMQTPVTAKNKTDPGSGSVFFTNVGLRLQKQTQNRAGIDSRSVATSARQWSSHASATATCEQSRPMRGEGKDQASDTFKWLLCTWMHMEERALIGRFVARSYMDIVTIVTLHPSRGSRINPTLKVWEHNRVAHASMAPDNWGAGTCGGR